MNSVTRHSGKGIGVDRRLAPRHAPIIFDLDGTLVDSARGIAKALNRTGIASERVEVADVRRLVSGGVSHLIKQSLNVDDAEVARAMWSFRRFYAVDPCRRDDLYPGVEEALACLCSWNMCLAVCTNKPQALAERVIDVLGLARYFDVVIGSDARRPQKPDPAPLLEAATRLGGTAPVLVGDSLIDALTAQAAQAPFIHASYGYECVENIPIAGVASSPAELTAILEELLWPRADPGMKSTSCEGSRG
jgi:phosphoglycolate phosphatase